MFNTPILFLIFNRLDTTSKVFAEIRKQQPKYLYIAADGPRAHKEGETERCQQVRQQVLGAIDWDCEVKTLFRDENLGCKQAVSSAINWFFEQVEMGIVLEDDCFPDQSFFGYCAELLEHYKDDERIMLISGDNFLKGKKVGDGSYYFSKYVHIWGWASWRRAWKKYDVTMSSFKEFKRQNKIQDIFNDPAEQNYWLNNFEAAANNKIDTWDYQWVYTILSNNGLAVAPNVNLISNIGFSADATHTFNANDSNANIPTGTMDKIVHPKFVLSDREADTYEKNFVFWIEPPKRSLARRAASKIKRKLLNIKSALA